jgi:alanine-glyoxylate transaminase/(R)-3-amino-2-methylpropionate-pyruvate transaminase
MNELAHNMATQPALPVDWSADAIINRRETYYSATQRAFVPYENPLIFKQGRGQYLWDEQGNKFLDLLGMNLCISVGHAHPAIQAAVVKQMESLMHCTTLLYHPVPAHYCEELAATMPDGHDWVVHLTSSGTEAADLAIQMARSYTGNTDLVTLHNAYHGATCGAQSLCGISNFRANTVQLPGAVFTPAPDQYRGMFGEGVEPYLDALDRTLHTATSKKIAGMFIEPIQGFGGVVPIPHDYICGAAERVRAVGGLVIADEVQCGFARTGENFWTFQDSGVVPDMVITAKGIGNGFPLGAVIAKREVAEAFSDKFHFHTFGANPMAAAAGRAVLQIIQNEGLQEHSRVMGEKLLAELKKLQDKYEIIGDVRGKGLMMGIELVKDKKTKEPAVEETARVFEKTREKRLVMSKSGTNRNVLRMLPPMCIQESDIEFFAKGFDEAFAEM